MSLDIHVTMNEESLAPFRAAWEGALAAPVMHEPARLLASAQDHHQRISQRDVAPFLRGHLAAEKCGVAGLVAVGDDHHDGA